MLFNVTSEIQKEHLYLFGSYIFERGITFMEYSIKIGNSLCIFTKKQR